MEFFGISLFSSLAGTPLLIVGIVIFIVGLLATIKGGDWFVDAASWFAERFGIPKFVIGATIVSIATTLPELLVSVRAAANGSTEMAIGNAIGSVTCNTTLIMGVSLCVVAGMVERKGFILKGGAFVASTVLLLVLCLSGNLPVWTAAIFWAILALFMGYNIYEGKKESSLSSKARTETDADKKKAEAEEKADEAAEGSVGKNIILFIIGAIGIVLGAEALVGSGTTIAREIGISEGIIGFTVIALGTSLPELVTMITALKKHDESISVGNIVGANVIDMTLILPLCAVISGKALPVEQINLYLDFPIAIAASVVAVVPAAIRGKFARWQGFVLVGLYVVYMALLVLNEMKVVDIVAMFAK